MDRPDSEIVEGAPWENSRGVEDCRSAVRSAALLATENGGDGIFKFVFKPKSSAPACLPAHDRRSAMQQRIRSTGGPEAASRAGRGFASTKARPNTLHELRNQSKTA